VVESNGLLTEKHTGRRTTRTNGTGRLTEMEADGTLERTRASGNPTFTTLFTEPTWGIVDLLSEVAREFAERLDNATRPEDIYPYYISGPAVQPMINGEPAAVCTTPSRPQEPSV
jgi:hypothetical protein